ncbi:response regulator transcription factor [Hoyosella sp. G463]|uniref:Response regulator transcription factor n=1 Tax=Lolliginicoccus lacisalsi TaxID=2742202 RepID=A0A927JB99_9ACTN|nr:response regulator transcription factor [Lolliginicoccus lacisalsi]MBD8506109.1 response regulator transcription factor [Lolliginicoccus lacisalsi]
MTSNDRVITVLLADDENLIRSALASMLSLEADLEIIAEAADGTEALAKARALKPDVAVLDLQMPGLDGVELAELLAREVPDCRTIIVTSHARPGYLKRALAVGARGFLPKTATGATLADVIRRVADGGRYVDPDLAADAISAGDSPLTPREADVLEAAADGAPLEEVARRVSLAAGTTRNYLSSAVTKLGARNRFDACTIARQRGWI